jgi:aminomuconate-semialdehyde/2-hydroxymuconate-6-semialdehyde dehydrogenase
VEKILNYINGELVSPKNGNWIEGMNPATLEVTSQICDSEAADVEAAIRSAESAFTFWGQSSVSYRVQVVRKIADLIEENIEELSKIESMDNGKPISASKSVDIPRSATNFRYFCDAMTQFSSECHQTDPGLINFTTRSPLGVVGCISPWNLPLYLFTWKIAPALLAGNTIVAKPSEVTPMSAFFLSKLCIRAGLPGGVLNIVHGHGHKIGETLNTDPVVKAISFTGSTQTGRMIATAAAGSFKKVGLEMGGKNPTIVFADADLELATSGAKRAAFSNQGQICLCGSRILVEKSIYSDFCHRLIQKTREITIGDPLDPKTQHGAMVSGEHFNKVMKSIELAVQEGGKILCGGNSVKPEGLAGYFIEPTLIEGLGSECRTNQEEIFGPVATIIPFEGEEQALEIANSTEYGLAASVWTKDISLAHRMSEKLEAGMVWVNCWMERDLRTPFGGVKNSGFGREGGLESLRFFTKPKNICISY